MKQSIALCKAALVSFNTWSSLVTSSSHFHRHSFSLLTLHDLFKNCIIWKETKSALIKHFVGSCSWNSFRKRVNSRKRWSEVFPAANCLPLKVSTLRKQLRIVSLVALFNASMRNFFASMIEILGRGKSLLVSLIIFCKTLVRYFSFRESV